MNINILKMYSIALAWSISFHVSGAIIITGDLSFDYTDQEDMVTSFKIDGYMSLKALHSSAESLAFGGSSGSPDRLLTGRSITRIQRIQVRKNPKPVAILVWGDSGCVLLNTYRGNPYWSNVDERYLDTSAFLVTLDDERFVYVYDALFFREASDFSNSVQSQPRVERTALLAYSVNEDEQVLHVIGLGAIHYSISEATVEECSGDMEQVD